MDLTEMPFEKRLEMMRRRQAYFSAVAEEYTSFEDFIGAQDMWLVIMGIELTDCGEYLKLYIQLGFTEYEAYYVIKDSAGKLTVSDIIQWQDDYCCNSWLNITTGKSADEEDISSCY